MTLNDQKNLLSIAYAHAVAAAAGFNVNGTPVIDDDSVDLTLCASAHRGLTRRPKIDLQLKCTAAPEYVGDSLSFALSRKNFDDLSAATVCPRLLVVLTVPATAQDWLEFAEAAVLMHTRAYWTRVEGRAGLAEDQASVTVHLPKAQRFDCEQLTILMEEANRG